jgi:hypothetical protein
MSHRCARTATAIALGALTVLLAAPNADAEGRRVTVRVYDAGDGTPSMRADAIRIAAAIVEQAGIAADWHDCTDESMRPECQDARRSLNFIVRFMPRFVPAGQGSRIALEAKTTSGAQQSELGFAIIDPSTLVGAMATIYHDRVLAVARRAGVERSELLGRALAHEVGHLLLQATGHSPSGLMRAVWTDEELTQNRADDWLFTTADRLRLQRNLNGASWPAR